MNTLVDHEGIADIGESWRLMAVSQQQGPLAELLVTVVRGSGPERSRQYS